VESTEGQSRSLLEELREVLNPKADQEAGRITLAIKKEWLMSEISKRLKPDLIPDDTVRESER
jgi:hypothetical protein